ncbi:MAG: carbohydrate-binding protein, partial [Lachnospirales bacterium]
TSNVITVTVEKAVTTVATEKPAQAQLLISFDDWNTKSSYKIDMNMWWGENAQSWNLYENGVLIYSNTVGYKGDKSAQFDTFKINGKAQGTYEYVAELVNDKGTSKSPAVIVEVLGGSGTDNGNNNGGDTGTDNGNNNGGDTGTGEVDNGSVATWTENTWYNAGDLVSYNGNTYECIHPDGVTFSVPGWSPDQGFMHAIWKLK